MIPPIRGYYHKIRGSHIPRKAQEPKGRSKMKREKLLPYFLVAPPILLILFIDFVPGVYAVFLSLFNIKYFSKGTFIGLANYYEFFTDKLGTSSLLLSIRFSMTLVILTFLLGLAFALVAQRLESKGPLSRAVLQAGRVSRSVSSPIVPRPIPWRPVRGTPVQPTCSHRSRS